MMVYYLTMFVMKTEILNLLKNELFEIVPVAIASYSFSSLISCTILYLIIYIVKVGYAAHTVKKLKKECEDLRSAKIGNSYFEFPEPRNKNKSKLKKTLKRSQ